MIDLCYILGKGSTWANNEIRYSLRSVEKHLSNFGRVFVIGEKPENIENIIHIPCGDKGEFKEVNIFYKVLRAAQEGDISENFLFFNDDHFLNKDQDVESFPNYNKGTLQDSINVKPYAVGGYMTPLRNCQHALKTKGYREINFDHHSPIVYNKTNIRLLETKYDWSVPAGYILKSLYGNTFVLNPYSSLDCKFSQPWTYQAYKDIVDTREVFSIGDGAINNDLIQLLEEKYPNKSRWEI